MLSKLRKAILAYIDNNPNLSPHVRQLWSITLEHEIRQVFGNEKNPNYIITSACLTDSLKIKLWHTFIGTEYEMNILLHENINQTNLWHISANWATDLTALLQRESEIWILSNARNIWYIFSQSFFVIFANIYSCPIKSKGKEDFAT